MTNSKTSFQFSCKDLWIFDKSMNCFFFFRSGFKIEGQNGERGLPRELKSAMKVLVDIFSKFLYKYMWSLWYTQCEVMFEYYAFSSVLKNESYSVIKQ